MDYKRYSFFFYFLVLFLLPSLSLAKELSVTSILEVEISGPITPATYDYLEASSKKLSLEASQAMLIKLNTPGGLVSTTKDILTLIGSSDFPIIVWITPEGASATSAGALISSGAHLLFMSEGTNIGAATPIEMTGDIKESDGKKKAVNDLVALVKGLSEIRGRNGKAFGEMITQAKSFSSRDALKNKIIDGLANKPEEVLSQLDKREILIKGEKVTLSLQNPRFEEQQMELGQKVLSFFANPMMAYILFIIGAALIYLEFQAPGGYIAGSIGTLCLVLAGIGFQILSINIGALLLIAASLILFLLEVYITSFGLLTIAGIAALITGSLLLFKTEDNFLAINLTIMGSVIVGVLLFIAFIAFFFVRDLKKPRQEFFSLKNKKAKILELRDEINGEFTYSIKVEGEIWKAKANKNFTVGEEVSITGQNKEEMYLEIE